MTRGDAAPPPAGGEPLAGGAATGLPARLVGIVAAIVRIAVVVALAAILVFTVGQVLDRHFFKSDVIAFDQFSRLGLVWLTFLGVAIGFRERANIRIDLLDHFLPPALVRPKGLMLDLVVLGAAILMIVVGWRLLEVGSFQVMMDTPFTYEVMYGALLLGLILLCLFLVLRLFDALTGGRFHLDPRPDDHDHH
jgi:TRAP-type C4-dicarboxylate transport system permease small subunit